MIYRYRCPNDHEFERVLPVAEYQSLQYCECGQKGKRQICPPMIAKSSQFESYESPITGEPITNNRMRTEEMAEHDCVDYEPTMKEESTRIMKAGEAALDKEVDHTVDKFWDGLTADKKQDFAREVTASELNIIREQEF